MSFSQSPTQKALNRLKKNYLAMIGLIWLILISTAALFADNISDFIDHPPNIQVMEHSNLPPSFIWQWSEEQKKKLIFDKLSDSAKEELHQKFTHNMDSYLLGTDSSGRDLFIRLIYGARVSLTVALICALVSLAIGVVWGAVAGYLSGWVDEVMMRFVDILYALPYIFFVIMVMSIYGSSKIMMFACIGAISWLTMSRIVRGEVITLKERDYVIASIALGAPKTHIITKHIFPNILGIVIIYTTLMIPQIILTETFLSWLGLGIQAPEASWGNLMSEGSTPTAIEHHNWMLIFPGLSLSLTLLALNFFGDGLRDAFDPKQV